MRSLSGVLPTELPRLARWCELIALAACVIVLVGPIALWLNPTWIERSIVNHIGLPADGYVISPRTQFYGALVALAPGLVLVYGLCGMLPVFRGFRSNRLFTADTASAVRRLGAALITLAVLDPIIRAAFSLILTLDRPGMRPSIALGVDTTAIIYLAIGSTLIALGAVMREAARIADENQSFI